MLKATLETLYMSFVSLAISFILALILGSIIAETRPNGLFKNQLINSILNRIVDVGRSIPFVLLAVFLFPFTRSLIGTAIGTNAMIVPLVVCAVPFEARMIEEILSQIPKDAIEAAQIDGANKIQIILFIELKSKTSLLVNCASISLINIIGHTAMAGIVGGGGLGNYAIVYGFQRYNWWIIFWAVLLIVVIVVIIQIANNIIVRKLERKSL